MKGIAWSIDIDGKPFIETQKGSRQFRIVFDVSVNPGDSLSLADISLFNLDKSTEIKQGASIVLRAGFEDKIDVIFVGYVTNRFREREGANIVTRMLCTSGQPANDRGSVSASCGVDSRIVDVLRSLARTWPRPLTIDESQFDDSPLMTTGCALDGDIPQIFDNLAYQYDFEWVQERGRIIVNRKGKERKTPIQKVNTYTGMVGIPETTRASEGLGVYVIHRLDPYFRIGGRIEVESEFQTYSTGNMFIQEVADDVRANGVYNIFALRFRGDSHGDQWVTEIDGLRAGTEQKPATLADGGLIWGRVANNVQRGFTRKVKEIAEQLNLDPNWLMAVMAFETGRSFLPTAYNNVSGATGLIQFIEKTAIAFGTTTRRLANMTAVEQLDFVKKYYEQPFLRGRIKNLGDAYMAIFWPGGIGKPDSHILFNQGSIEYTQNSGLDYPYKGYITRGDAVRRVNQEYKDGQQYIR